ncbi:Speckle-type POZ protein like [Argiope bruennichi]|uniref:Speckle-type POZ protein like n=1 Tax=Argiope bruennichi TaxID=94029 RepID=A0A8T0EGP7_ARGBR|nr:Speckle-type POZ protein like [Argiope bruennichi]
MEVSTSDRNFTFTWRIKNFSFLWYREHQFLKWIFDLTGNNNTSWSLLFYPSTPKNCVSCILRKESRELFDFLVDYELSFLQKDGSPLHSIKVSNVDFNHKNRSVPIWLHHDDLLENKESSLPDDTLRICCRIWTTDTSRLEMVKYLGGTEIKVQRCSLTWDIVAFSGLKPGRQRTEFVKNTLTGKPCISFGLFLDKLNNYIFEIFVLDPKLVEHFKCQIFLVDVSGRKLKCGRFEVVTVGKTTDPDWKFQLSLTKRNLMENKELYLRNDTLTLLCEIAFATGIEAEPIQKLESDFQDIHNISCNEKIENISGSLKNYSKSLADRKYDQQSSDDPGSVKEELVSLDHTENNSTTSLKFNDNFNSLHTWNDDLLLLYEKGTFCDAELLVESTCFPVHSLILSIRSSVFCDMFTRAKCEGKSMSINIKDLDAETIRKMILFLYTDTLGNLEWECAKGLYMASNKYKILSLKDISSSFLKQNLSPLNCCEILLLADRHEDEDLKQAVQYFIAKQDIEILNSEKWRSLEEYHPQLTIETFRSIHLKFRKN